MKMRLSANVSRFFCLLMVCLSSISTPYQAFAETIGDDQAVKLPGSASGVSPVNSIQLSHDEQLFLSYTDDRTLRVWNMSDYSLSSEIKLADDVYVKKLLWAQDDKSVLIFARQHSSDLAKLFVWNISRQTLEADISLPFSVDINDVIAIPNTNLFGLGLDDFFGSALAVVDNSGQLICKSVVPADIRDGYHPVALTSLTDARVAVVTPRAGVVTYDTNSCLEVERRIPSNSRDDLVSIGARFVYAQHQKSYFVALEDSVIKINQMTGQVEKTFSSIMDECRGGVPGEKMDVHNIALSKDETVISAVGCRYAVQYNAVSGLERHRFIHGGDDSNWTVRDIAQTSDQTKMITASRDGHIRIWAMPSIAK